MRVACSDVFLLPALEPFGNEQACAGISRRKGKKKKRRALFEGKADIRPGKVLGKNSIFSRVRTPFHGSSSPVFTGVIVYPKSPTSLSAGKISEKKEGATFGAVHTG